MPESITYAEKAEIPDLSIELLPPAEQQYTEKDALLNQYGKQFQFDLLLIKDENGEYTGSVGDGGCLFSPDMVHEDELEAFRQKLVGEGLGSEIDWDGVKSDLYLNSVGFGNAQRLGMKADYLASRYAVLEARIEADYAGDEKEKQMDILNGIYEKANFMDEFMNKMDQKIYDNRQHTVYGLRQHPIDRNAVYRAFHNTLSMG